jgi:hypothetical protein
MSIKVEWDNNEQRNTILVTFESAEAWDAIEEGYKAVYALMENGAAQVDVIIDVRSAPGPVKPAALIALTRAYLSAPGNAGGCVLLGAAPMTRSIAENCLQSSDWHYRILMADSLVEARQRLGEQHVTHQPATPRGWAFAYSTK